MAIATGYVVVVSPLVFRLAEKDAVPGGAMLSVEPLTVPVTVTFAADAD